MTAITAPAGDTGGATLDAQIAHVQALVSSGANLGTLPQMQQILAELQVTAIDHYMTTVPTANNGTPIGPTLPPLLVLNYLGRLYGGIPLARYADVAGNALDAQIGKVSALIAANANPVVLSQLQQTLTDLQMQMVDRYMAT